MNRFLKRSLWIFVILGYFASTAAAQTVSGTVFRDYNANGTQNSEEPGVSGLNIDIFDATGSSVGSTTTTANGTYTAALSVGAGTDVRVELSGIPSYLSPGPFGTQSGTTVLFVQSGDSGIDIGLANPGQHCPDSVDITTSCFVTGPQDGNDGVLVTIPESAGSDSSVDASLFDLPAYTQEADASDVGAVWGLAYHSRHNLLYAGSFVKRLSDIGPTSNPTSIYVVDRDTSTISTWLTLDGARGNPHSGDIDGWARDFDAFDDVFKEGLGDIDISEDENTVFTIDLGTRELVTVAVNTDGSAGSVTNVPIISAVSADITGDGCNAADIRPFGLGVNDGTLYVGIVCSGQASVDEAMDLPIEGPIFTGTPTFPGDTSLLRGYVYAWDGGVGFSQVLNFPLDYSRGCLFINNDTTCQGPQPGFWRPWVDTYPYYDQPSADRHSAGYAQPVISDIEFDNGDMVLGLGDRWGHQTGPRSITPAYPLNEPPNTEGELRSAFTGGDMLRACASGSSWLIEELVDPMNTGCGTAGMSSNAGATQSIDEYYFQDNHSSTTEQHSELTLGGMTQIPGRPDVIAGVYDPVRTFTNELDDGGLVWFDNSAGTWTKGYRLYNGDLASPGNLLLKAAGIGDLAPFCPAPSIEVGNRVWDDSNDSDGLQDPGEPGINGVTVRLFCNGSQIASTTTSNMAGSADDGSYLFNDGNVTGGIPFFAPCEVRIDPADVALGGRLATSANSGSNDQNDSDGVTVGGGNIGVGFSSGGPGANNHTYDFGFTMMVPAATITTVKTANPTTLPEPGGMVTYTVMVTNDSASVGVTITSLTDSVAGDLNGQGTCSVPQVIAASGSYSCQYTRMVSGNAGDTASCTVTASGTDDNMNPVSDDDPEDVTITGLPSSIVVVKTANPVTIPEPGGMVTYTVMVTNTSVADTVTIDTLTDDVEGNLNGVGTCSVPQVLAPSESYSCEYTTNVTGNAGDTVTCTVTASGTDDDGNPVSDDDPETVTITGLPSSIVVQKTADPTSLPEPGGEVTYTVLVTNTSAVDTVTIDTLIDDVTGDLNGVGTCSVTQVITPGNSYSCEYTVMVTGVAGDNITCTVTASGTDDDDDPVSDDDPETVTIGGAPQLTAIKEVTGGTLLAGGTVEYTISITNVGTADQPDNPDPEFLDTLDEALTLLDAVASDGDVTLDFANDSVIWDGSIAVDQTVIIMIVAEIAPGTTGEIVNQACVFYDSNGDGDNDTKVLSDDPTVTGPEDPNVIVIIELTEIPTLSPVGVLAMMFGLLWVGARRLRRRES